MFPLRGGMGYSENDGGGGGWLAGKEAPQFKKRRSVLVGRHADDMEDVDGASSTRRVSDGGALRGRRSGGKRGTNAGRDGERAPRLRRDMEQDIGAVEEEHLDMDIGQVLPVP
jgi:hypothetical protein